jgi:thymidylate synthase
MNADYGWVKDLEHIFKYGTVTSPRGMKVYEVVGYKSTLDMNRPIIFNKKRKLGYKFMAAEAAWILSGDDKVSTIAPYSKDISQFSDDGEKFFGAYGPKVVDQLGYTIAKLVEDRDTRQAVVNIWRESPPESRDIPCTLSLQWLVRNSELHCVATMRSSDLWLGHPYDVFNFSAISFYILLWLRKNNIQVNLGDLHLTAGSKHIYERNVEMVGEIVNDYWSNGAPKPPTYNYPFKIDEYSNPQQFIDHLGALAGLDEGALRLVG